MRHLLTISLLFVIGLIGILPLNVLAQDGGSRAISAENVQELVEVERFGYGTRDAFAWTPDESLLAVGGSLGVWIYDGQDLDAAPRYVPNSPQNVHHLALNGDGTQIAIGWGVEDEQGLIVLEVESGETILEMTETVEGDPGLQFSADGSVLVAQTGRGVLVWDLETVEEPVVIGRSGAVAFSPDGRWIATIGSRLDAVIYDMQTGETHTFSPQDFQEGGIMGPAAGLVAVAFTDYEGETVLATMHEESDHVDWLAVVRYWDIETGSQLQHIATGSGLYAINESIPAEDKALTTSINWSSTVPYHAGGFQADPLPDPVLAFTLSSFGESFLTTNGTYLFTGNAYSSLIDVWDLADGQHVHRLRGEGGAIHTLTVSQDGRILAAGMDETLNLWHFPADRTDEPELTVVSTSHSSIIIDLGFNSDQTQLVTASFREIITWDFTDEGNPTEINTLLVEGPLLYDMEVNVESGDYVYKDGLDGTGLKLVKAETGELIRPFEDVDTTYRHVEFAPDGSRLLTVKGTYEENGADDIFTGQIVAWDVESGDFLGPICDPILELAWFTFSPDGSLIVAVSADEDVGTLILDARTGDVLRQFDATGEPFFSAAGDRLFIANIGVIYVWGLPDGE